MQSSLCPQIGPVHINSATAIATAVAALPAVSVHLQRGLPLDLSPVRLPSRHRGEDAPSHRRPRPAPILASSPAPCPPWYEAKCFVEICAELLQVDASLSMVAVVPRGASQNTEGHEVVQLPRKVVPLRIVGKKRRHTRAGSGGRGPPESCEMGDAGIDALNTLCGGLRRICSCGVGGHQGS